MSDSTELYYAEMESARNEAEDLYFAARPRLIGTADERSLFRAGFERGFQELWNRQSTPETGTARCPHCDAPFPSVHAAGVHALHCKAT
jgi:hypothetical protein